MIGIDEAGRGPLFGRVYTSAVILPEDNFDMTLLKDSKKFTSKKKIKEVYDYIKENALYYSINYSDENEIDTLNILGATIKSMKESAKQVITQYIEKNNIDNVKLFVDGSNFNPLFYNNDTYSMYIPYECVIKGDSIHKCISAASILAKVERDNYIENLCNEYPELDEKYNLKKNKGYGTKKHIEGIKEYGYSEFHRKSFKLKSI